MSITSRLFATEDAVERWFAENDLESVAFEYPVSN
jgi:hypothetical protein